MNAFRAVRNERTRKLHTLPHIKPVLAEGRSDIPPCVFSASGDIELSVPYDFMLHIGLLRLVCGISFYQVD